MSFKGGRYCFVRDCTSCEWRSNLDTSIPATSFFRIPKDEDRAKIWLTRASREDLLHLDRNIVHNSYRICSLHFEDSAFMSLRQKLSCKAVPTIFNHSPNRKFLLKDLEQSEKFWSGVPQELKTCEGNKLEMKTEQVDLEFANDYEIAHAQYASHNNTDKYNGHLCRLCATVCNDLLDIFGEKSTEMSVVEKIHLHLPIKVTKDDELPLQVCSSCILKLDVCTEIVSTSLASQSYLRTLLGLDLSPDPNDSDSEVNAHLFQNEITLSDIGDGLKEISTYSDDVNRRNSPYQIQKVHEQNCDIPCYSDTIELQDARLKDATTEENITSSTTKLQIISTAVNDVHHSTWKVDNVMVQKTNKHTPNKIVDKAMSRAESPSSDATEHLNGSRKVFVTECDLASRLFHDSSLLSTPLPSQSSQIIEITDLEHEKNTIETIDDQNECQIFDDLLETFIQHSKNNVVICESENSNPTVETNWHELNEPELVCWFCSNGFANSDDLIHHQLSHHPKDVFFCTKCKVILYEKKTFDEHTCASGNENPENKSDSMEDCGTSEHVDKLHSSPDNEINAKQNVTIWQKQSAKLFDLNKMALPILSTLSKCVSTHMAATEQSVQPKELLCSICDALCETQEKLQEHHLTHPCQKDESRCKFCNKKFLNKYKTIDHERIHTKEKPYVCEFCGKCFRVKAALTLHIYSHNSKEKRYACDFVGCEKRYATKSSYSNHRITHDVPRPYLCDVCGKDFKHNSNLQIHRHTHFQSNNAQTYTCGTCGKLYNTRYRLKEHIRTHTDEKPYTCQTCGKQFHKVTQLGQHKLIHANAQNFACQYCGKRFNRRGNMLTHARRHERTHPFKCTACNTPFHSLKEVMAHRKTHTEMELNNKRKPPKLQSDATFKCDICGKCLSCKATLQKHLMLHTGIKTHQCFKCEKSFLTKTRLTNHLAIHLGIKPFTCKFCPEGFNTKNTLAVHERIHTGERPFQCSHCSKSFRSKFYLQQHLLIHSDDRPFPCPHCQKTFRRRGDLDVHVVRHTDRRPFACPICDQRFKRNADCKNHEQKHAVDKMTLDVPALLNEANAFNSCFLCGHVCENSQDLNYHYEDIHTEEITSAPNMIVIDAESLLSFPEITVANDDEENLESVLTAF